MTEIQNGEEIIYDETLFTAGNRRLGEVELYLDGELHKVVGVADVRRPRLPLKKSTETISAVYAMQMKMGTLFTQMIGGRIAGFSVEMDRETFPATFTITTWKK